MPKYLVGHGDEADMFIEQVHIIDAANEDKAVNIFIKKVIMTADDFLEDCYASGDFVEGVPVIGLDENGMPPYKPSDKKFEQVALDFFDKDQDCADIYINYFRKWWENPDLAITPDEHRKNPIFNEKILWTLYKKGGWSPIFSRRLNTIPRF